MYGDIIVICNFIYVKIGDMVIVQELINSYFVFIIFVFNDIKDLNIFIYFFFGMQFVVLIFVVQMEFFNI